MLGEISPHHEYYDSKSSTETPPSYNQLNYNENLERFFKSKPPVTTMYGSDEENVNSSNDDGKTSPTSAARKCMSPINGSGASGSGSAENLSSGSNNQTSSASGGNTSNTTSNATIESFKPPTLTESLLNRHNENMEKLMMQKHRELRSSIKNNDKLKDARIKIEKTCQQEQNVRLVTQGHGIKRSGSHSREGDSFKVSKHDEISKTSSAGQFTRNLTTTVTSVSVDRSTVLRAGGNINLWSPLSVVPPPPAQVTASSQNANSQAIPRIPVLPSIIPVYYVPVSQQATSQNPPPPTEKLGPPPPPPSAQSAQQSPYMFVPVSYLTTAMAGVIYPPVVGTSPQGTMTYRPFPMPEQITPIREISQLAQDKFLDRKRPASQATSIKAEPGSTMAMSDSSKKVLSPGELFSSCSNGGCSSIVTPTPVNPKFHRQADYNVDESTTSSFYSSFLYRSSDSSCNPDQKPVEFIQEEYEKPCETMHQKEPPWLEGVQLTPEVIYEYQVQPRTLNEVLQADMDTLKNLHQPLLVNDQLEQLYLDLEVEGFETKLVLEDGITSSGSDSGGSSGSWTGEAGQKQRRRMVKYGKLVMIHEENAPLPPPPPSQSQLPCQRS